ncbi:hypothetical protein NL676_015759 [Syzygium grande]|nr:hypothetical protein NL676_015759 [Syzygium grande]
MAGRCGSLSRSLMSSARASSSPFRSSPPPPLLSRPLPPASRGRPAPPVSPPPLLRRSQPAILEKLRIETLRFRFIRRIS